MGRAIARRTSGGTGVGPGAKRYRFNIDRSSLMKPGGASTRKEPTRYHLHLEAVKKTDATTDDVFRIFSSVLAMIYVINFGGDKGQKLPVMIPKRELPPPPNFLTSPGELDSLAPLLNLCFINHDEVFCDVIQTSNRRCDVGGSVLLLERTSVRDSK